MNKPLPLDKLPEYLKSGNDNVVVDIGSLSSPPKRWPYAVVLSCLLCFGAGIAYKYQHQEITIVVDTKDDISQLLADEDVLDIRKTEDSVYEVKINTRNKKYLLDWLKKNKNIKNIFVK